MIMITTWCPPDKASDIGKKLLEVTAKFPQESFETNWLAGIKSDEDGIQGIWLTEIEKGKLEDALNIAGKRVAEYLDIEGYRFKIETLMTFEDALPLIGLTPS